MASKINDRLLLEEKYLNNNIIVTTETTTTQTIGKIAGASPEVRTKAMTTTVGLAEHDILGSTTATAGAVASLAITTTTAQDVTLNAGVTSETECFPTTTTITTAATKSILEYDIVNNDEILLTKRCSNDTDQEDDEICADKVLNENSCEKEQYIKNNNNNNQDNKDENNIESNDSKNLIINKNNLEIETNTTTLQNIDLLEAKLCKLNAANNVKTNSNSNNWCTQNPLGKVPETTEEFLIALGVDLHKSVNLPETPKQLANTFLCDDAIKSTGNATVTVSNTIMNNVPLSIKSNNHNNANSTPYDLNNSLKISNIDCISNNSNNNIADQNGQAKIVLICESNSHPFQTRTILLTPNIECKVGRLIVKSKASESNAIFDCKVLSRNHAVLWYTPEDQKFWVKDTKSSNGTFINDQKLGNEAAPLHFGDVIKFGVDVTENLRKEVHGCIIASVKLYLPDGREAISIDSMHNVRSAYSGEKFITYDELHRLNLYVQEVSTREKNLKSKLFNIQNILDATRKNSGLCWQALIAEDQLLHRIHMLEKKLQVMEKNVPESSLRNEVIKLLEDKNSYQHTAKEALRKVYQERCEAMQLLAKMEATYAQSENECKLLREQVMNSKHGLQEVSDRLLQLGNEYIEYKEEVLRQQEAAKEQEDARVVSLMGTLRERDIECGELKRKISELMTVNILNEQKQLERQAIDSFDAVIADLSLEKDDEEDAQSHDGQAVAAVNNVLVEKEGFAEQRTADSAIVEAINGCDVVKLNNSKNKKKTTGKILLNDDAYVTVSKLLQNSDLNKNDGVLDIFKVIMNGSDSSEDEENEISAPLNNLKRLQTIYNNLHEMEANMANVQESEKQNIMEELTDETKEEIESNQYVKELRNDKNYTLLQNSIELLREAYNCLVINQQDQLEKRETEKECMSVFVPKYQVQQQQTLKQADEDEEESTQDDKEAEDIIDGSEVEDESVASEPVTKRNYNMQEEELISYKNEITQLKEKLEIIQQETSRTFDLQHQECNEYRKKFSEVMKQLDELRAEKDFLQEKLADIKEYSVNNMFVQQQAEAKGALETPISSTATTPTHSTLRGTPVHANSLDKELLDDEQFSDIDAGALDREDELIIYKENLEKSQLLNFELRKEISMLRLKIDKKFNMETAASALCARSTLVGFILPFGAAVLAVIYFLITNYN